MPTRKTFKRCVRARMTKTGESYTAARRQLLRKSPGATTPNAVELPPALAEPAATPIDESVLLTSDESMRRRTGKGHAEWFAILDAWGATDHTHTEIARWLGEHQGLPSWWTQNITVAYERARGMRARHQMRDGYSVTATKTVGVPADRALAAFTEPAARARWMPDAPMRARPTRAALSARFDWSHPASRVIVTILPKGPDKSTVAIGHERIEDAAAADGLKAFWRARLGDLKKTLEAG